MEGFEEVSSRKSSRASASQASTAAAAAGPKPVAAPAPARAAPAAVVAAAPAPQTVERGLSGLPKGRHAEAKAAAARINPADALGAEEYAAFLSTVEAAEEEGWETVGSSNRR
jgi:hypothetical protein